MSYEATGKIHLIGEERRISDKLTKRALVLEIADNPKYPQFVEFEATKDRCQLLDDLRVGDTVFVDFNLRGREWKSPKGEVKFFNTLDLWKIELAKGKPRGPEQRGGGNYGSVPPDDDIPF